MTGKVGYSYERFFGGKVDYIRSLDGIDRWEKMINNLLTQFLYVTVAWQIKRLLGTIEKVVMLKTSVKCQQ